MEHWSDQAIVLSARRHGEGGAIVVLLTENHGRHAGYVHGGMSSKKRNLIEPGTCVRAEWHSRVSDNLGTYTLEAEKSLSINILDSSLKLKSLLSACALCDVTLPEREGDAGLYHGLVALIESFEGDHWQYAYIIWEIQLLRELGFRLELDKCAAGGDPLTLTHVSPKSGRAVSAEKAIPYSEKLLILPDFLRPAPMREGRAEAEDIALGLAMTAHFLEHWVFTHHTKGLPQARMLLGQTMMNKEKMVDNENDSQLKGR